MPASRFSFLFTYLVATGLILGFHSSPYFVAHVWSDVESEGLVAAVTNSASPASPGGGMQVTNTGSTVTNSGGGSNTVTQTQGGTGGGEGGIGFSNPLKYDNIEEFLYALLDFVIKIGYVAAVFFIILSGFKFVVAQGNSSKIEEAREMLMWTIIGTAILIGAQVLANMVAATIQALSAP